MSEMDKLFDHPCKQTCSGWRQGYDKGKLDLEQQRFNNKNNLSIDQKVADKIKALQEKLDSASKLLLQANAKNECLVEGGELIIGADRRIVKEWARLYKSWLQENTKQNEVDSD